MSPLKTSPDKFAALIKTEAWRLHTSLPALVMRDNSRNQVRGAFQALENSVVTNEGGSYSLANPACRLVAVCQKAAVDSGLAKNADDFDAFVQPLRNDTKEESHWLAYGQIAWAFTAYMLAHEHRTPDEMLARLAGIAAACWDLVHHFQLADTTP